MIAATGDNLNRRRASGSLAGTDAQGQTYSFRPKIQDKIPATVRIRLVRTDCALWRSGVESGHVEGVVPKIGESQPRCGDPGIKGTPLATAGVAPGLLHHTQSDNLGRHRWPDRIR